MAQFVKIVSIAFVFGMSLLPAKAHVPVSHPAATAVLETQSPPTSSSQPVIARRLDEMTQKSYDAAVAKAEAEAAARAAAEAKAKADADAAAAAAAAEALAASRKVKTFTASAPAPAAPALAAPAATGSVPDMIRAAFASQGQAAVDWGLRVAKCESGYNPLAHNPSGASGVFQFMPGTFAGTPYGNQSIFDAAANVNAAAWYYQRYGGGAWSCT